MSNQNSPYFGIEDTPLTDSDDEDLSNDLQGGENIQRHPMAKFIRFTVIGSLIGGFGLVGIAVVIGVPGELVGYAGAIGASLGAIIGAAIGSPPWLYYVSEIFDKFRQIDRQLTAQKWQARLIQISHMTCMIPHMESSATNLPLDLLKLYKEREVKRITTFADVAGQLDPDYLVAAYARARDSAPRRHDRNRTYFVDHSGPTNRSEVSNRREEHLALALWGASQTGRPMVLPTDATLEIVDYQTPLKAQQKDTGVGKVDLFGLIDGCRLTVIELKVRPTTSGYGDTPLHAYLEALAYCSIVEANASDIANEARTRLDKSIDDRPPGLIVMAPQDYWAGYLEHPSAGEWWPILSELATEIDKLLNLETHFLGLRDAEFRMGTKGQPPQMIGHHSIFDVNELAGD